MISDVETQPGRSTNAATMAQTGKVTTTIHLDPEARQLLNILAPYRGKGQFISRLICEHWTRMETRQEALLEWQRQLAAGAVHERP